MCSATHAQSGAMPLGERIAVLTRGVLQQIADPFTLYHHPANQFVAGFIGSPAMNFLGATVAADGAGTLGGGGTFSPGPAPAGLAGRRGKSVTVGVRPEDLTLDGAGGGGAIDAT